MSTNRRHGAVAKRALFGATMLAGLVVASSTVAAPMLPTGGKLAAGSATIGAASGASLTVSQSSSKAIIDWSSFGVGQGGTVQFDNGSGATLNRVTGANVSSIDGRLSATGSVYLINPNGVIVGKTGVVDTGGSFVASTLDVGNSSFLAGGPLTFSGPSTASVVNLGKVGSLGGNVGLIAATVRNDGTITAPKGDAGLAAGTTVTLDDAANDAGGLFSVKVGGASTSATNAGAIAAAAVELRAQQGNVYALAGATGGVINATGIDASGGTIKLISERGTTEVAGALSAQGPNGAGGQIETSGEALDLGAARVDTHGGSWLLDPTNLIVDSTAASAIDTALGSGNVTLATSASGAPTGPTGSTGNTASGAGDIIVAAPITWSTGSTLTLDAYAALIIEAPITVTGAGDVVLDFNTAAADAPGGLSFGLGPTGFAGSISYAAGTGEGIAGQALTINGTSYTLLYSIADIGGVNGSSSDYAIAAPNTLIANYSAAVVTGFGGTLEGLGNTVSFSITDFSQSVGLFEALNSGSLVRDLGIAGGTLTSDIWSGWLAAFNEGTVEASYSTGKISSADGNAGGLVGENSGTIEDSYSTAQILGYNSTGGLVGKNSGIIKNSFATGAVSGRSELGGLVGYTYGGTIEASYATGSVSGASFVGGLVGEIASGTIETSYATGAAHATTSYVGGLVGVNLGGVVETSYATGAASGYDHIGGLIGENSATVQASYATGAVSGTEYVGGLIGVTEGTLRSSYATGPVSGGTSVGGLAGLNTGTIFTSFWDTMTTGQSGAETGATGLTTAQMQSNADTYLGTLNSGGPVFGGGVGGLYPYLVNFFPNGVQAIVGMATSGGAPAAAAHVGVYAGGALLSGATVSTGANGYFYLAVPAGTLGASGDKIGADITLGGGNALVGLVYTDGGTVASNVLTLPTLAYRMAGESTAEPTLSLLAADLSSTFGAATYTSLAADLGGAPIITLTLTGPSFTLSSGAGVPLTVSETLILTGGGALNIDSGGALAIDAPITVTGGGQVALTYGAGGLNFDLGASGFAGSLSYAVGAGEGVAGQALTINGTSYALLYSMVDVAGLNGGSGHGALAAPITASGTYTAAVVAGFSGTLEGLGNSVSGLTIDSAGNDVGLIGTLGAGGAISDLGLSGGSVTGVTYVGGLVGAAAGGATISDSLASGATVTSSGGADVGGVVGYNAGAVTGDRSKDTVENSASGFGTGGLVGDNAAAATVSSSTASGAVSGGLHYVGGLVGYNAGSISSGSSTGKVTAPGALYVGGLVGYNAAGVTIAAGVTSTGIVSAVGGTDVGGLVGINFGTVTGSRSSEEVINNDHGYSAAGLVGYNAAGATISGSSASGPVYVGDDVTFTGGLVGYNAGAVTHDSATGNVSAPTGIYVGGLVGYSAAAGTISSDFASQANVSASGSVGVGGLVGYNGGAISDTYADIGLIVGGTDIGGLIGFNRGAVSTSWSSAAISENTTFGGSIGYQSSGTLSDVYWDEGTSGLTNGTGAGLSTGLTGIGGTTGLNPDQQATYAGFNFTTVWTINPGTSRAFLLNPAPATPPN